MANLPLAFAELLSGGVLVAAGLTGQPIQDVFAGNLSLGSGSSDPSGGSGGGSSTPARSGALSQKQARQAVTQGLTLAYQHTGDARLKPTKANVDTVLSRAFQESGFDPSIVNTWDSNAKAGHPSKGFLQTIQSTFDTYAVPGHTNIEDAVDNTAAATIYMIHTYGHLVGAGQGGY